MLTPALRSPRSADQSKWHWGRVGGFICRTICLFAVSPCDHARGWCESKPAERSGRNERRVPDPARSRAVIRFRPARAHCGYSCRRGRLLTAARNNLSTHQAAHSKEIAVRRSQDSKIQRFCNRYDRSDIPSKPLGERTKPVPSASRTRWCPCHAPPDKHRRRAD
jgi:hypothetical protein